MQELIQKQRRFFDSGATLPVSFRIKQLKQLKKAIRTHEGLLYEAIAADFRKSKFETYATELGLLYHEIDVAIDKVSQWARRRRVPSNLLNFPAKSYLRPEPLGVSLVIGAWNYPYLLSLGPVIGAMAAGCTVILKPSELPSQTSAAMATMISVSFAEEYVAVVEGGVPETTQLLEQRFDKIFFTGSTKVGKIIYQAAAKNLTPVTLELGGKSPAFVTADCNLKITVKRLVWGKFLNAGQTCISPDYVLVDRKIEKQFLEQCVKEIEKEQFSLEHGNISQIINDRNLQRLRQLIDPGKVVHGGKVDAANRYIEPTLLAGIDFEDTIMQEEIFGPLLPVIAYDNLDEAIGKVKTLEKPLSCYVFTRSARIKKQVMDGISFGGGMINDAVMHITNSHLPFGGVGASGIGAYHGKTGFDTFSHQKGVIEKKNWLELPLKYFPHTPRKLWWIQRFFKF
ncbi:MAG: aldehyde dehydrogenase [Bacteroidota bacterium]